MKTCCWILIPNSPGVSAVYCGEKVSYKMLPDDDNNKVRKYEHFCKKHKERAEKQDEEDDGTFDL